MEQYNASLPYDRLFYAQDIAGSIAFARANKNNGILTADEFAAIEKGFVQIKEEWANNTFVVKPNDEDIHTANERRLSEIIGKDIGGKLHTGRSRNEQVATDMRLYARRSALELVAQIDRSRLALVRRAREHAATLMPGYTHLQRAQVVTLGHHLLAYAEMLSRDRGRLVDAERRAAESPLGLGALAGTGLPIDRAATAAALGFSGGPTHNSLDAVSDRDFAAEIAFATPFGNIAFDPPRITIERLDASAEDRGRTTDAISTEEPAPHAGAA